MSAQRFVLRGALAVPCSACAGGWRWHRMARPQRPVQDGSAPRATLLAGSCCSNHVAVLPVLRCPLEISQGCSLSSRTSSVDAVLLTLIIFWRAAPRGGRAVRWQRLKRLPSWLLQSLPCRSWRRCKLRKSCGACGSPSSTTSASFSATCPPQRWWASVPSRPSWPTGSPAGPRP